MALIDLQNISKHYSAQKILTEINFHVDEGERIVIIGKNGSGKSTLMKIVNGTLETDGGERIIKRNLEVKMLDQRPDFKDGHTVREAVEDGLGELNRAKVRYNEISILLGDDFENKNLIDEHENLSRYIEHHNAWNLDDKIERIIQHFDLKQYEDAQGEYYREDDEGTPLWFTTRCVGEVGSLIITTKGNIVPDMSQFDQAASIASQYGGNFGQELAKQAAQSILGGDSSAPASTPAPSVKAEEAEADGLEEL